MIYTISVTTGWREKARALRREVTALYLACRDPRTPWYAKLLAVGVVAYACSPIDLIPDPIPILGLVDDLILIPLGVLALEHLIPPEVLSDCRSRAATAGVLPRNWIAAGVVIILWVLAAVLVAEWIFHIW